MHASEAHHQLMGKGFHTCSGDPSGVLYQRGSTYLKMVLTEGAGVKEFYTQEIVPVEPERDLAKAAHKFSNPSYELGPKQPITLEQL